MKRVAIVVSLLLVISGWPLLAQKERENDETLFTLKKEITLGDLAQTISLPLAVLLALIPIKVAAKEHSKRLHLTELMRLLDEYDSNCRAVYEELINHQQGLDLKGQELEISRERISHKQKDLQLIETQILAFLPKRDGELFKSNSLEWWKKLTEFGIVVSHGRVWNADDSRLPGLRDAQSKMSLSLTMIKRSLVDGRICYWTKRKRKLLNRFIRPSGDPS